MLIFLCCVDDDYYYYYYAFPNYKQLPLAFFGIVSLCLCPCMHELTGFILVVVDVNIVGLHDHEAFTHQSGWSRLEIQKVTV